MTSDDVGAEADRRLGHLEGLVELRRAGAGHERHAVGGLLGDDAHRRDPLGDALRARLAGRPTDRDRRASPTRAASARGRAGSSSSSSPVGVNGVTTGAIEPRTECWIGSELHAGAFVSGGSVRLSPVGLVRRRSGRATRRSSGTDPSTDAPACDLLEDEALLALLRDGGVDDLGDERRRAGPRRRRRRRRAGRPARPARRRSRPRRRPPTARGGGRAAQGGATPSRPGCRGAAIAAASRTAPSVTMPAAPRTSARGRGCRRSCRRCARRGRRSRARRPGGSPRPPASGR